MSLRAKMEAVIYAAEEPVTLAQLSALFRAEALEERVARLKQESPDGAAGAGLSGTSSALFAASREQSAENAADEHAEHATSDASIEEAIEHPEQVAASQPDGFAEEPWSSAAHAQPSRPDAASSSIDEVRGEARRQEREAREEIRRTVDELMAEYDASDRGMEIREIAGGYRVATKPEYHDAVRSFVKSLKPPMKLTLQALETLAVIAYKQPVTAPEVSDIRGVDSGGVLGSLISRKLVTTAGRKQVIGRPILYKTTKEFLLRFGLKDLAELPSMEEFEKMAGELVEPESSAQLNLPAAAQGVQGAMPMSNSEPDVTSSEPDVASYSTDPHTAADLLVSPERAEEREEEELRANARANIQLDDESAPGHDLPGVTRDTAGRMNIDSRAHAPSAYDEEGS